MLRDLTLQNGSKIAIIGGGPAGASFAHFAQKWALKKSLKISITIFDGKDFLLRGPKGCNLCAGVIAESLNQKLKEEGIFLPEKRIINRVEGYCFHVAGENLLLSCTAHEKNTIATVFRGNGPRYSTFPENISFDDFLLTWAQDRGAKVIPQPVWDIKLPQNKSQPVSLYFGEKNNLQKFEADLVVGAFGVNSYFMKKIQNLGFGYKPPSTLLTFQAEVKLGQNKVFKNFGNNIHVYMPKSKIIRYATLIPKGDYVSITLIGKKDAAPDVFQEFLNSEEIKNRLPSRKPHCFCYPRIVVSSSKKPFTDRLVIVGDASFSRHYKNGIESAFLTAKLAAETAFQFGIDSQAFANYYKRAKALIIRDNYFGRFLFFMNDIISSVPILAKAHLSIAREKTEQMPPQKIKSVLWNMFTGNIPYQEIFRTCLNFKLQTSILKRTIKLLFMKRKPSYIKARIDSRLSASQNLLQNNSVVVIIGGGPAGSTCAIKLKKLALKKGINPRIIIYEGKRFEKKSYYNQCLGVLSPPLKSIMEEELAVPFPWHIIQKEIGGYFIHSDHNTIKLAGEHDPSYACRRVEFDNYLFQKAKEMGVEVFLTRVTDLDLSSDSVMVYSESNNIKADVVVGAFGLDDGMAKIFERITSYRQPKFLYSIVTKIHPGQPAMDKFGNYIHAFLPTYPSKVEFGAITPKGNHLSLNIAGKKVNAQMMDEFLNLATVRHALPENLDNFLPHLYYFKGKFPTFPAKGTIGDRYVMVGDAAGLNRPFKGKGINSAVITGIKAAEAIANHGFSKLALQNYLNNCKELIEDVPYGRILRHLTLISKKYKFLDSILETSKNIHKINQAFFNIVSGQKSYKKIWNETKDFKIIFKLIIKIIIRKITRRNYLISNSTFL